MKSMLTHGSEADCDGLVLKTIEDVLMDIFGERTFKKILLIMRRSYSLEWSDIPHKSQDFSLALQKILGAGSMIIEDLVIENLYLNLGLELTWKKGFSFSDYISELPGNRASQ